MCNQNKLVERACEVSHKSKRWNKSTAQVMKIIHKKTLKYIWKVSDVSQRVRQQSVVLTEILGFQTFSYSTIIYKASQRFPTLDFIMSCIVNNLFLTMIKLINLLKAFPNLLILFIHPSSMILCQFIMRGHYTLSFMSKGLGHLPRVSSAKLASLKTNLLSADFASEHRFLFRSEVN